MGPINFHGTHKLNQSPYFSILRGFLRGWQEVLAERVGLENEARASEGLICGSRSRFLFQKIQLQTQTFLIRNSGLIFKAHTQVFIKISYVLQIQIWKFFLHLHFDFYISVFIILQAITYLCARICRTCINYKSRSDF